MLIPGFLLTNLDLEQDTYPLSVLVYTSLAGYNDSLQNSLGDTDCECHMSSNVANPVPGTSAQLSK